MSCNATWRTSSYSGAANNCVELHVGANAIMVRDKKARNAGMIALAAPEWSAFLTAVKLGQLGR
jgi:Domain of unknown function (DUF397)